MKKLLQDTLTSKWSRGKALEIFLPELPTQVIISHLHGTRDDYEFLGVEGAEYVMRNPMKIAAKLHFLYK